MFKIEKYRENIKQDLLVMGVYQEMQENPSKDILIVVHNQLDYLKQCIASVRENTKNYQMYVWDNGSDKETIQYLKSNKDLIVHYNDENLGFIIPNNELIKQTTAEYIILLNSDTKVYESWDDAMIAQLIADPEIAQVGYMGGLLNEHGEGSKADLGYAIDFIPAWCTCIHRSTYEKFGLFDQQNLEFAYCEDADFSLRLKEGGRKIYALYLDFVEHYGSKTIQAVHEAGNSDVERTFAKNHAYLRNRWRDYLKNNRILLKS